MANDFKIKNGLQLGGEFLDTLGTVTGNATLDLSTGNVFSVTPTDNVTFTFSNAPASGTAFDFALKVNGVLIDNAYDLANAVAPVQPGKIYVGGQTGGNNEDVFFKPDGTKMYVVGLSNDSVYEYNLTTAWEISTAVYVQSFNVGSQETLPTAVFFKTDGTKMYISGYSGDDVNEYSLSTAWNISTASYVQAFSVAAQENDPNSLFFKPDGTKMYVFGYGSDAVNEYSLSTAWDVSTASYVHNFSVSSQDTVPFGLFFKDDGTKMYITGDAGNDVNEYSLSSAWDVSTASYVQNFSVSAQVGVPTGLFFKSDGTKMYIIGRNEQTVYSYTLTSAWDISSASFDFPTEGYFSVAGEDTAPLDLFLKPDGTKMYVVGYSGQDVNEYDLSTAWEVSSASYVQNFSVASQETQPSGLFFKPDGTKMYVLGITGQDVNEYSLSSAWDISTASYVQNFSISSQETVPLALFFKHDGTRMYVTGEEGLDVNEYSLSTAWDISTASYVQNFSVSAQETSPRGLFFKPDGTKMYITGAIGDDVNEYSLSTAWDISTASYVQNFSIAAEETIPQGVFFGDNGTKMYIIGTTSDAVWQYSTGTYGDATFTYPASVDWPSGTPPTAPADGETDILAFSTTDGGTTWYGVKAGDNMS